MVREGWVAGDENTIFPPARPPGGFHNASPTKIATKQSPHLEVHCPFRKTSEVTRCPRSLRTSPAGVTRTRPSSESSHSPTKGDSASARGIEACALSAKQGD